ncbi:MAG: hypothetical protein EU531_07695 [Promethearchaeota archaeon]|nr:MAG: hypothetical protein EU531_07695 [Candidatus Lokiarchaeota archaeon]
MNCNYNNFDRTSDWEKNYMEKLAVFQSLLKEKHLLQYVSPEERKEFEVQLESAFTDVLIAFEEELVDPSGDYSFRWDERNSGFGKASFSLGTGIKDRADIPHQCEIDETTKSIKFQLLMKEMGREGVLGDYLDKICDCIKNRKFPDNKLESLGYLVVNLNKEEIESNQSLLRNMIEMGFKETEQSVFRSIRLDRLVDILNETKMMDSYSSRLKSLISNIISAMEADDTYEYHVFVLNYFLSAIKRTVFMDYFYPRIEPLFLNLYRVEKEKDPDFWQTYYSYLDEIVDTKLEDAFFKKY